MHISYDYHAVAKEYSYSKTNQTTSTIQLNGRTLFLGASKALLFMVESSVFQAMINTWCLESLINLYQHSIIVISQTRKWMCVIIRFVTYAHGVFFLVFLMERTHG